MYLYVSCVWLLSLLARMLDVVVVPFVHDVKALNVAQCILLAVSVWKRGQGCCG